MLKGEAEFVDPESGNIVATFNEVLHDDGNTIVVVRLRTPMILQGTELLEIVGTSTETPVITVGASEPSDTPICEFHGRSELGFLPDGAELALVKTPGGPLGTLLTLLGRGKVHESSG